MGVGGISPQQFTEYTQNRFLKKQKWTGNIFWHRYNITLEEKATQLPCFALLYLLASTQQNTHITGCLIMRLFAEYVLICLGFLGSLSWWYVLVWIVRIFQDDIFFHYYFLDGLQTVIYQSGFYKSVLLAIVSFRYWIFFL